ncbi:hypothetical protein EBT31_10055 [bacterium]|nr:hypothetical protein [bacterium]
MKLIVSDIQAMIARVIGTCTDDPRVYEYINQACRRLLHKGLWAGAYGRFTIFTNNGCITWPRQIETIEAVADCCAVGTVRNQWFEFQETGFGLVNGGGQVCLGNQLLDRGTVVSYRDLSGGTNNYLRVYPGDLSDVGKTITLQGTDNNGQWIRTQSGSIWIDGEKVTLALPYVQTTKKFTTLTGVIRQATNTVSRLYEYDATTLAETDIAVYDPDETLPQYRRSYLGNRCNANEDKPVTVMAKMRHINASTPNDYLIPPCADAIKLMVQAIRKEENDLLNEAVAYEAKAVQAVQEQTMQYLGDAVHTIRMVGAGQNGGGLYQWF